MPKRQNEKSYKKGAKSKKKPGYKVPKKKGKGGGDQGPVKEY